MAIKGIDIYEERDFVSKFDEGEDKTIWKIGVLDNRVRAELGDMTTEAESSGKDPDALSQKIRVKLDTTAIEYVRFGLRGFENFVDKDGKLLKFDTVSLARYGNNYKVITPRLLNIIPFKVLMEISTEILSDNKLTEKERKN